MTTSPKPTERVLSTLNEDGSRRWLRPRLSKGRFLSARRITSYILILIFTVIPYTSIGGKPTILLDIAAREFTLFGKTFLPTDTLLLALLMVAFFITIFLFTALLGRVWCGWACPQTVYMEFLFRPIERLLEGAPGRRKKAWQGTGATKIVKYLIFLAVSVYLAHTFLAYFVGVNELAQWVRRSPFEHPASFIVMLITTGLMMIDFCYFREQICIVCCPYGRLQSALLDDHSLIVTYDENRGEPRGKPKKAKAGADVALDVIPQVGDCVDCNMCVTTCPTGIDIREGLQMECIGCAQCIDACDAVMSKLGRTLGLIRYSSQAAITSKDKRILRPRVILYPVILAVVLTAFIFVLATKDTTDVRVFRGKGPPFSVQADGSIANPLQVNIVNRTQQTAAYLIGALDNARIFTEENPVNVLPGESRTVAGLIVIPPDGFVDGRAHMIVRVSDQAQFSKDLPYNMIGPYHSAPTTQQGN